MLTAANDADRNAATAAGLAKRSSQRSCSSRAIGRSYGRVPASSRRMGVGGGSEPLRVRGG